MGGLLFCRWLQMNRALGSSREAARVFWEDQGTRNQLSPNPSRPGCACPGNKPCSVQPRGAERVVVGRELKAGSWRFACELKYFPSAPALLRKMWCKADACS